jgi:amidase
MNQAEVCDSSQTAGLLFGIPVLIKDNIQAIGLPGTAGSLALAGRTVVEDAELVTRLRAAGAIIMGSTNLSEWANIRSGQQLVD